MALKFKYAGKDQIPAEHASFYVERDGAWMLDVDGAADKSKLDEFRTTNVALIKERDDLKARFEGIDPEEELDATSAVLDMGENDLTHRPGCALL